MWPSPTHQGIHLNPNQIQHDIYGDCPEVLKEFEGMDDCEFFMEMGMSKKEYAEEQAVKNKKREDEL